MVRALKWMGIAIGGVLILAVLLAILLPSLVSLERYRNFVASRVARALGRDVRLQSLQVSVWRGIGAEARGIQVAEAAGFGAEPFLTADALRMRVQLLPLLKGQMRVTSAVLERPRIRLQHAPDGHWSIDDLFRGHPAPAPGKPQAEAARPAKAPFFAALILSEVAVRNGELTLVEQGAATPLTLGLADLDLSLTQKNGTDPIEVRSRARLAGEASGQVEATARITPGDAEGPRLEATLLFRDADWKAWGSVLPAAMALTGPASGEVRLRGTPKRLAFGADLDLKAATLRLGRAVEKPAGEAARLSLQGEHEDPGLHLSKMTLGFRDMTLEGNLRIPDLKAPRLRFTLASPRVDLDRLLLRPAEPHAWLAIGAAWAAGRSIETRAPKSQAADPGVSALGRVKIAELLYRGLTWNAVEADLQYQDGLLAIPSARADFLAGRLSAKGEVDLRAKQPRVSLTSRVEGAATEPLVKALSSGSWRLASGLEAETRLSFVGFAGPDILGSASGEGSLTLTNGRITNYRPLERLSELVAPILQAQGVRARLNEFDRVSGHYTVENGLLRTRDLTLTKPEGTVTAVGALGLQDSSLNFDVVVRLGRTTIEAKVTGTTAQPIVVPKLGRLQRKIETEIDKILPDGQGQGLKDLFRGLFNR